MLPKLDFLYFSPKSLKELKEILDSFPGVKPCWLAGGTDLWVDLPKGKKKAELIVDLKGLPGLDGIRIDSEMGGKHLKVGAETTSEEIDVADHLKKTSGVLRIGALCAIHRIERDPFILEKAPALARAAACLGSLQVRNRATLGGNLANGAPTADTAAPLLALDASLRIWSPEGERIIPAAKFWRGPGRVCLGEKEILLEIIIPCGSGCSAYLKQGPRQAMDIGILSASARLRAEGGVIREAAIALGGAGPVPLRCRGAEERLLGERAAPEIFEAASKLAVKEANPRDSRRASRAYRLELIPVLVERVLIIAWKGQEAMA